MTMTGWRNAYEVASARPTDRPKKTGREVAEKDRQIQQLNEDAMDRSKWSKLVKDVLQYPQR